MQNLSILSETSLMSARKPSYFLVHTETGQSYPIRAAVIIGRGKADIVFPRDSKISNQHCEVIPADKGLGVRDLHSANGTRINGKQITADRGYLLKVGGELSAGEQVFTLQSVSLTKNLRKRRKKQRSKAGESYAQVFVMLIAALLVFAWNNRVLEKPSEIPRSQKQLAEIFENYQELEMSVERQTAEPREISRRMQGQILGRLAALSRRWGEFQPSNSEQAQFTAQLHFANALAGHAKSEILYINSGDAKYFDEIDQWTAQLENAVNELRSLPGGTTFPNLVQSPLQLVEREMRQSLREYKKLGENVRDKEVTPKQMAERIRTSLMPKMNAVYSKMGAIHPQNDFERRKVVLEQKLMTAFLGQVKSLSLTTDTPDPKYANELAHWTEQIEKIGKELKEQLNLGRAPGNVPGT